MYPKKRQSYLLATYVVMAFLAILSPVAGNILLGKLFAGLFGIGILLILLEKCIFSIKQTDMTKTALIVCMTIIIPIMTLVVASMRIAFSSENYSALTVLIAVLLMLTILLFRCIYRLSVLYRPIAEPKSDEVHHFSAEADISKEDEDVVSSIHDRLK